MKQVTFFKGRAVDPAKNLKSVESTVLFSEGILGIAVVIVTGAASWFLLHKTLFEFCHMFWPSLVGSFVLAAVLSFVTDIALSYFLEESVFQLFNWPKKLPHWRKNFYRVRFLPTVQWLIVTSFVAALFYADWYGIRTTANPLANMREKPAQTDFFKLSADQISRDKAEFQPIDAEINRLNQSITDKRRAVRGSNKELAKLESEGNGWAAGILNKKTGAAVAPDEKALAAATAAKAAQLARATDLKAFEIESAKKGNLQTEADDAHFKTAIIWFWTFLGIGLKILMIGCRVLLVVMFLNKGSMDANGDGQINGADVTAAAKNSQLSNNNPHGQTTSQTAHPLAFNERRQIGFGRDEDGNPPLAQSLANVPTAPIQPVAPTVPLNNGSHGQTMSANQPKVVVIDLKTWQYRLVQCHRRTVIKPKRSLDSIEANKKRVALFTQCLNYAGIDVELIRGENEPDYDAVFKQVKPLSDITDNDKKGIADCLAQIDKVRDERRVLQ